MVTEDLDIVSSLEMDVDSIAISEDVYGSCCCCCCCCACIKCGELQLF